jgi:hypothetical protein
MNKSCYLIFCFLLCACRKQAAAPEDLQQLDPAPTTNYTLAQLNRQIPQSGIREINSDWVVSGVVIADDRSGNFYKQVVIDDGTAAIAVLLDAYNLYAYYPVGRKVYIRCKGLALGYYNRLPQLGYKRQGELATIPFHFLDQFLLKGPTGNPVLPMPVLAADAATYKEELLNRLVSIAGVQVTDSAADLCFALPPEQSSATNIQLTDCKGSKLIVRTSGYSSFRATKVPKGRGTITAIYTVYNNTPQLLLRDPADMDAGDPRCH